MAAFINTLREEATKEECLLWVEKLWDELTALRVAARPFVAIAPVLEHGHDNMGIWSTGSGEVRVTLGHVRNLLRVMNGQTLRPTIDPIAAKIVMMEPRT